MPPSSKLVSASLVLGATILAGRLSGVLREIQIGAAFGLSRDTDFAVILLTTPDLLVSLLLAGGLSAALIPEFRKLDAAGRTALFVRASLLVGGAFGAVALLVAVAPRLLMALFAPAYLVTPVEDYAAPFMIAALAIPLAGLSGVTAALLNSQQRFFMAGAGTLIFNCSIIAVLALASERGSLLAVLAMSIALGALLRYAAQLTVGSSFLSAAGLRAPVPETGGLFKRFATTMTASTLLLLMPVVIRSIVSLNGAGNIAAFNFSLKLFELPVGIAIMSISTVAFPMLCELVQKADAQGIRDLYAQGVERALCIALAIALPAIWFAPPTVQLVFGYGRMSPDDLALIADLARIAFFALPAVAVTSMSTALLNARGETQRLLARTVAALATLPLAVAPGIVLDDVRWTMAALPFVYYVLAAALFHAAGYRPRGMSGLPGGRRLVAVAVACTAVTACFAALDWYLAPVPHYVSVGLAGLAGGSGLVVIYVLSGGSLRKRPKAGDKL